MPWRKGRKKRAGGRGGGRHRAREPGERGGRKGGGEKEEERGKSGGGSGRGGTCLTGTWVGLSTLLMEASEVSFLGWLTLSVA